MKRALCVGSSRWTTMYSRHSLGFLARSVFRRTFRARTLQLPHFVFIRCTKNRSTFTPISRSHLANSGGTACLICSRYHSSRMICRLAWPLPGRTRRTIRLWLSAVKLCLQFLFEESRLWQQFEFDELRRAKLPAAIFHHRQSLLTTFLAAPSRQQDAGVQKRPGHASPPRLCLSSSAMPSLSRSSPPARRYFSRKARSFLPVAVFGFYPETGWHASFSETAARINSLRFGSGIRLKSDNGIFTVTASNEFVIFKMHYPRRNTQANSLPPPDRGCKTKFFIYAASGRASLRAACTLSRSFQKSSSRRLL